MAASPKGVYSLRSGVLPRMNIWVHKRIPPLDGIGDHAQFLVAMKRVQVVEKPEEVSIAGTHSRESTSFLPMANTTHSSSQSWETILSASTSLRLRKRSFPVWPARWRRSSLSE